MPHTPPCQMKQDHGSGIACRTPSSPDEAGSSKGTERNVRRASRFAYNRGGALKPHPIHTTSHSTPHPFLHTPFHPSSPHPLYPITTQPGLGRTKPNPTQPSPTQSNTMPNPPYPITNPNLHPTQNPNSNPTQSHTHPATSIHTHLIPTSQPDATQPPPNPRQPKPTLP